jgi:hypothetical protein
MKLISKHLIDRMFWVSVFGVAMGFLEAIVVIYLRELYYPQGFEFPMSAFEAHTYIVELVREVATLVMLAAIGFLAGRTIIQKLCYFLYSFAVWDIIYYLALKIFLNWPPSLLTWDVLFLIPLPWLGPVIAPILVSLAMIWLSTNLLFLDEYSGGVRVKITEWLLIIAGASFVFISFIWNYSMLLMQAGFGTRFWNPVENRHFLNMAFSYRPDIFNWPVFLLGLGSVLLGSTLVFIRLHPLVREPDDFLRNLQQDVRSYLSKILPI